LEGRVLEDGSGRIQDGNAWQREPLVPLDEQEIRLQEIQGQPGISRHRLQDRLAVAVLDEDPLGSRPREAVGVLAFPIHLETVGIVLEVADPDATGLEASTKALDQGGLAAILVTHQREFEGMKVPSDWRILPTGFHKLRF
jgi:hypothetical protein